MTYNMTILQEDTTVSKLFSVANSYTSNSLIGMFSIVFFFVLLSVLKKFDFKDAFISASFISFVIGGLLSFAGFLNFTFPILYLTMAAAGILIKYLSS